MCQSFLMSRLVITTIAPRNFQDQGPVHFRVPISYLYLGRAVNYLGLSKGICLNADEARKVYNEACPA